jgi:UDP-sugar pyrophosphorylase
MPEFVNPKYADASKNSFKSPTRLECMMQARHRTLHGPINPSPSFFLPSAPCLRFI